MAILRMFKDSALELKNLRCLTVTAVLIALDVVLKSVNINVTDDLKITFAYLALASIGMLFGPTVAMLAGVITDLVGMLLPTATGAFNPLFTVVEVAGGMVYGLFLYRMRYVKLDFKAEEGTSKFKKFLSNFKHIWRIVVAKIMVVIVCNIILNPIAMILSGYWTVEVAIFAKIPTRLIKYAIQTPVDIILMILVLFPVLLAYRNIFKNDANNSKNEKIA